MTLFTTDLPFATTQVGHTHNLDNQTSPSSEMLGSLPLACLWIILLPSETRFRPLFVDGLDEVEAQIAVELSGLGLVRPWSLCIFLFCVSKLF
jgi:hypothetical protein